VIGSVHIRAARLDKDNFLGGGMLLDADAAAKTIEELAAELGLSPLEAPLSLPRTPPSQVSLRQNGSSSGICSGSADLGASLAGRREAEIVYLRQRLIVLKRTETVRPRLKATDRLIFVCRYPAAPASPNNTSDVGCQGRQPARRDFQSQNRRKPIRISRENPLW
jgi:hypothetical protein